MDHAVVLTPDVGFIVIYDEQQFVSQAVYSVVSQCTILEGSLLVNTRKEKWTRCEHNFQSFSANAALSDVESLQMSRTKSISFRR